MPLRRSNVQRRPFSPSPFPLSSPLSLPPPGPPKGYTSTPPGPPKESLEGRLPPHPHLKGVFPTPPVNNRAGLTAKKEGI